MEIKPGKYFEIAYQLFRINADGSETLVHEVTQPTTPTAQCAAKPSALSKPSTRASWA